MQHETLQAHSDNVWDGKSGKGTDGRQRRRWATLDLLKLSQGCRPGVSRPRSANPRTVKERAVEKREIEN